MKILSLFDGMACGMLAMISAAVMFVSLPCVSAEKVKIRITPLGEYKITAYSGNTGSTYGASGDVLIPGEHAAASSVFPFGTELYISGVGIVKVKDRFDESDDWFTDNEGKVIDLYLDGYEEACRWGLEERKVYLVEVVSNG